MDCSPLGSSVHGDSPGKNEMGCCALLQGIFPAQGSNLCLLCLLYWQADSLPLHYLGGEWFKKPLSLLVRKTQRGMAFHRLLP